MEFTGERFVPEVHGAIELEHLHRYYLAKEVVQGKIVLDIASGEGYGSYILSKIANKVIGVDISEEAVTHAKNKYVSDNLDFLVGSCAAIPLPDNSVDVIVSFETIEHHTEHEKMMEEIKRILKIDGCLIISSPDKLEYSDKPNYSNPHHVKELYRDEFKDLLTKYFKYQHIYGQRIAYGSAIMSENAVSEIATYQLNDQFAKPYCGIANAIYLIAITSDVHLPVLGSGLLEQSVDNSEAVQAWKQKTADLHSQFDGIITKLSTEAVEFNLTLTEYNKKLSEKSSHLIEREQRLAELNHHLTDRDARVAELNHHLTDRDARVAKLNNYLIGRDGRLAELNNHLIERDGLLVKLNNYLTDRDRRLAELDKTLADRDGRFKEIEARLQECNAHLVLCLQNIADIRVSHSWRITAPLRFVSRQVKRVPIAIKLALPAIKLGGGVGSTVIKACRLYRREGIAGIKRGFRLAALSNSPANEVLVPRTSIPALTTSSQNEVFDHKEDFKQKASVELNDFLKSEARLVFNAERLPRVSIIIVVWNSVHLTYKCLKALLDEQATNNCPDFEVIIFNNASSDKTSELLAVVDGIQVINSDENIGFLLGCNKAAEIVRGDAILLLNSDAFVRSGALYAAYAALYSEKNIGAVGGRIVLPSGVLQEAGSIVWADGSTVGYCRGAPEDYPAAMYRRQVDYCSGAFLMTPVSVWRNLKGFDESYVPAYYEEVDYCLRVRESGFIVLYQPWAVIDHFEFGSESKQGDSIKLMLKNRERLVSTHKDWLTTKAFSNTNSNLLKACNTATPKIGRLLVFDDQVPFESLGAGLPRMRALLNVAANNGWQVTFFALHRPDINWEQARREFHPEIEFVTNVSQHKIEHFLKARTGLIDVMIISRPNNMKILNECFDHSPELLNNFKLIYDAEAVFSVRDMLLSKMNGEIKSLDSYTKAIDDEVAIGKYADAITCVSVAESFEFSKRLPATVSVLNHSISATENIAPFQDRNGFLFVGRLLEANAPNRLGLAWFVKHVWPLIRQTIPNATLQVVGHITPVHSDIISEGVVVRGAVADLSEVYSQARVFIAPIQFAAGIPIKIIEAAAAGLPVVGTTLMTQQLGWTSGVEIQDADAAGQMALKAIELHENIELWNRQSNAALVRVANEFSSRSFSESLLSILSGPVNSHALKTSIAQTNNHRRDRVNSVWGSIKHESLAKQYAAFPLSHPYIKNAMNYAATGNKTMHSLNALVTLLPQWGVNVPTYKAASVCCGTGAIERHLHLAGVVRNCIGYDLSSDAIEQASQLAKESNLDGLEYKTRDLDLEGLDQNGLDFIIANQAVHHIDRLESVFDNIHAALRPGGIFYLDEFVGPNRFQWSDIQIEEMTKWLQSLPEKYTLTIEGEKKHYVARATIQQMIDFDPSEAVRSEDIERVLRERFDIIETKNLGGTLTMMALAGIAQNFDTDSYEDCAHLQRLLDREKKLIDEGVLISDFKILIARKREVH